VQRLQGPLVRLTRIPGAHYGAHGTVVVLEQEELNIVAEASRRLGKRPIIRMCTEHAGHFESTSGKDKFGLSTMWILVVVTKLKALDMLDCL
jgi:arginine decarboxylase-like protein